MTSSDTQDFFKQLDWQDFLTLGIEQVAYIRPTQIEDQLAYAICAADGTTLSVMESYESALGAIHSNDMDATTLQ